MFELKKIEDGLLNHFKHSQSDFRECPTEEARNATRQGVVDFLVDAWVFCRQYPVLGKPRSRRNIGQQECISSFPRESLYKYVLGSLKKYPNRAFLATSNNFLDLDHQIILDFLDESGLNDTSPQSVLQIAAAWLQRNHEISRPDAVGNKESGIHLKSFVINLKLHDIRTSFISE